MSKRFAWLLGVAALVLIAFLVACSSTYNSSSDGLIVISSQGSALLQSFSFSLASGRVQEITNSVADTANETCVLPGFPSAITLDPAGAYAYVILTGNSECPVNGAIGPTGIQAFKVNSDGTITSAGNLQTDPNPIALAMDSAGKFLFVAEGLSTTSIANAASAKTSCAQTASPIQYGICVYAIGSGGSLTAVPQTFVFPATLMAPNFAALAVSPTVFPPLINGVLNAQCSNNSPPTTEYLYVADSTNYMIWQFAVDPSTGALGNPGTRQAIQGFATGQVPSGVAVDPCNRFVYVSNQGTSNTISAFTICDGGATQSTTNCPVTPDGSLNPVVGSPFSNPGGAGFPGPLVVDAYGNFLYVLNGTNNISPFRISPASGSITPLSPSPVAAGLGATSIAIRSDDSWLFVTNNLAATVSQYSVTPASGALTPVPAIQTDNQPWGVAVK